MLCINLSLWFVSLTRKLEVEARQGDAECLENRLRKGYVHVKVLLACAAELHVDAVVVELVYQLEILDRGLVDSAIKV